MEAYAAVLSYAIPGFVALIFIEYFASLIMKKPVISTDLPTGVPWVNQHEKTGLIVPPNDVLALRSAMMQLWDNASLRKSYGQQAYARVSTHFTYRDMIQKTQALYQDYVPDMSIP